MKVRMKATVEYEVTVFAKDIPSATLLASSHMTNKQVKEDLWREPVKEVKKVEIVEVRRK